VGDDAGNSVFAFLRHSAHGAPPILCVVNMTPVPRHAYRIGVSAGDWAEVLNSDAGRYGGGNLLNAPLVSTDPIASHGQPTSITLTLPPLGAIFLRHEGITA